MTMRHLLIVIAAFALLTACHRVSPEERAQEGAKVAAKAYYDFLLDGRYEQFVGGKDGMARRPADYREQMEDAAKQFMAQQQELHNGIRSVRAVGAQMDSSLQVMQVFLVLCYGDSVNEQVMVPMVEREGVWLMK